ncbi:hypothetical protein FIBSPDRAFT_851091 [Athelia psychrophila]|uniref:Uncharacterized protein n=1 Tax=Athelia psychrophila TaxID=1759441 RepID=A0A166SWT2_9AGAM|nr:hypothetical protein FIBSPDRAFT_851091 [Fibularhizoctonia sp. CBS 109695]
MRLDIFHDSHFVAAANTFQDHIFSGWRSEAQADLLARFDQGVRNGTVHAPWKDEVWESTNPPESTLLAGEAAEQDLRYIIESSLLKVGDILAYKRTFSNVGRSTVEKDALIEFIDPRTSAITVFVQPGLAPLPRALQEHNPPDPTPPTQSMTITSLSQLENGLLDLEGRVGKADRPYENTWKHISLWRWPQGAWEGDFALLRGGRECHGTLFYLRGNLCYDL